MGIESAAHALAVHGSEDADSRVVQGWCATEVCATFAYLSWISFRSGAPPSLRNSVNRQSGGNRFEMPT